VAGAFNGPTFLVPTSKANAGSFPQISVNFLCFPSAPHPFCVRMSPLSPHCATNFPAMACPIPRSNKCYSPNLIMAAEKLTAHAVILAGGRGTRFWPRSRTRTPKQLLNIIGAESMLQQTVARLKPVIPAERIWTVTNAEQAAGVRKQVPAAARKRVLIEPMGQNTAVAIGLAAIHVRHAAH